MKKLNLLFLFVAMATMTLTSCNKDDDNNSSSDDGGKPTGNAYVNVTYADTLGAKLFNYFDISVKYYDANGDSITENLNSSSSLKDTTMVVVYKKNTTSYPVKVWYKKIKFSTFPAITGYKLTMSLKSEVDTAGIETQCYMSPRYFVSYNNAKGIYFTGTSLSTCGNMTIAKIIRLSNIASFTSIKYDITYTDGYLYCTRKTSSSNAGDNAGSNDI